MESRYRHLTLEDRRLIFRLLEAKHSIPAIAARIGVLVTVLQKVPLSNPLKLHI